MANQYVNKVAVNGKTVLDLSGDTVYPGMLAKGITAHDKSGAQITGTLEVPATEERTVELSMPSGDQVIQPTSGKVMSKVTVRKPATLLPENIKKDVVIGGVTGTLETGGGSVQPSKSVTITSNGTVSVTPDAPYDALKKVDVTVDVASGGGSAGFKVTFPATATNWDKANQSSALLLADGTTLAIWDYTSIAGQTISNVVGIRCNATNSFYVLKMTLTEGSIAQCDPSAPNPAYAITTSPNMTPTPYAAGQGTFWWPIADTLISQIEMYYTD